MVCPQLALPQRAALALLGFLSLSALCAAPPAQAQLRACNHYDVDVNVAMGFYTGGEWATRGWYTVVPGACATLMQSLPNRYYYLHYHGEGEASISQRAKTAGEHLLCVDRGDFMIPGTKNCRARGYAAQPFRQIDTEQYTSFQIDMVGPRRTREGVKEVRVGMRTSMLNDSKVVRLRNVRPYHIEFDLRCYTRSGSSKLIPVSVGGGETAEVGFLQGWEGNFVPGERCEAYYEGERLWNYTVR